MLKDTRRVSWARNPFWGSLLGWTPLPSPSVTSQWIRLVSAEQVGGQGVDRCANRFESPAKALGGAANSPSASRTLPRDPFWREAVSDCSAQGPALPPRPRRGVGYGHCPLVVRAGAVASPTRCIYPRGSRRGAGSPTRASLRQRRPPARPCAPGLRLQPLPD